MGRPGLPREADPDDGLFFLLPLCFPRMAESRRSAAGAAMGTGAAAGLFIAPELYYYRGNQGRKQKADYYCSSHLKYLLYIL